jgi:hypothetical protein
VRLFSAFTDILRSVHFNHDSGHERKLVSRYLVAYPLSERIGLVPIAFHVLWIVLAYKNSFVFVFVPLFLCGLFFVRTTHLVFWIGKKELLLFMCLYNF